MIKIASNGGDTSRKIQCCKFRELAYSLGFKKEDIPEEVSNGRMQRFDEILDFTRRAVNQKKSNRKSEYELDRISRYFKDVLKKNIVLAYDVVVA